MGVRSGTSWLSYLADNWQLSPIIQAQSGLPFTLVVSGSAPGGSAAGGIQGTNAFPNYLVGRNTYPIPTFRYVAGQALQVRGEIQPGVVSLLLQSCQHVNVTSVTNTAYTVSGNNLVLPAVPNLPFNLSPTATATLSTHPARFRWVRGLSSNRT